MVIYITIKGPALREGGPLSWGYALTMRSAYSKSI